MGVRSCSVVAAALLTLVGGLGLSACSNSPADSIAYAVDGALVTYNTNTVAGAASGGPQAFARALTGFNYHGPDGQVVGDHDFGTLSVVGRAPLVLDYEISPNAVYSDGKPVTCDDMVLAWASQSGRLPGNRPHSTSPRPRWTCDPARPPRATLRRSAGTAGRCPRGSSPSRRTPPSGGPPRTRNARIVIWR